ncbi:MAG: hypothetical protein GX601_18465, partial [Anaerolineales bacterium]|nr:hypothetical protein [Anaerolineales bacterium]
MLLTLVLPFVIALVAPAAGLTAPRIADNLAAITEVRPLDVQVTVPGDHSAGETYEFAHALGPDPESLHPVAVYSEDYGVLWGMGEHATAFDEGSQAYVAMFGDGRDGDLTVPSGQTVTINSTRTSITASGATATVGSSSGFGVGDRVFVHQSQGTANVGRYELATIAAIDGASWTFEAPLAHTYSSASGKAQAVRIPQYQNVTVQGTLTAPAWDSSTGGILVVLANGLMEVSGTVSMDAKGFRGGREQVANSHLGGQGGEGIHDWSGHGGGGDPPYQARTPGGGGKTMDGDGAGASSGPGTGGAGGGYTYGNQTDEGAGGGGGGGHTYGGGGGGGGTDSNKAGGSGGLANAPTGGGGGGGGCGGGCDSPNSYGGSSGQPGGAGSFGGGAGGGLGNTGGGGNGQSGGRDSGAGGGGGGSSYGTPGLSALHLGSGGGGGGGHEGLNQAGGAGGAGGG